LQKTIRKKTKKLHLLPKNRLSSQLQDPLEAFGQLPLRHLETDVFGAGSKPGCFLLVFFGKKFSNNFYEASKNAWLPISF